MRVEGTNGLCKVAVRTGRPPVSRGWALELVRSQPRVGRNRTLVRRDLLARKLDCSPRTVSRIVIDLERSGDLWRIRLQGHRGMLVEYLAAPRPIRATHHLGTVDFWSLTTASAET